jgi:methylated-DNA-protein-cysteine methyltransferase related protein
MASKTYQRVYEVVAQVPRGRVVTYGQIAMHLGMPHGARVVGWAMRTCPAEVPWHRVVNAQGRLIKGEHPEYCDLQRSLLEDEGVQIGISGCVDLAIYGWDVI